MPIYELNQITTVCIILLSDGDKLTDAHLFQVTSVIPPDFAQKFAVEYLGIDWNEYKIIEHDKNWSHQETLFEVLDRWRTRIDSEGKDGRGQLYQILKTIQETKGWFSRQDIAFLSDGDDLQQDGRDASKGVFPCVHIAACDRWVNHLMYQ